MSDILSQLRQLGVSLGMPEQPKTGKNDNQRGLQSLLRTFPDGIVGENDYGEYFINRIVYPLDSEHGCVRLSEPVDFNERLQLFLGTDSLNKESTLAMDTETSGLASVASAFVFMIGMGYFTDNSYIVDQLILPDLSHEKAFLAQIERIFARFETLLTYNGKSFDIPMIRSRINFNLFPDFTKGINHIDFLPVVRRFWRSTLENCKLSTLERDVLHVRRGEEEVPGYLAPEFYREYLNTGNAQTIKGVAYHNQIDVLSLSAFMIYLSELCQHDLTDPEIIVQSKISLNDYQKHYLKVDFSKDHSVFLDKRHSNSTRRKAAHLYLQRKETQKAISIYQSLIEDDDFESCMILSSLLDKDTETLNSAIELLKKGIHILDGDVSVGLWSKKEKIESCLRQIKRLEKKYGGSQ